MNIQTLLAVVNSDEAPPMLKIIFWLLLLFWGIGAFGFQGNPRFVTGSNIVLVILFGILGWFVLGFK